MARTFDPQHTSRLMILGGSAVLLATLLFIVWLRHQSLAFPLAESYNLRFGGLTLFGLTTIGLFDLFVFVYESIRSWRRGAAKR
jgi:hypothetical protein